MTDVEPEPEHVHVGVDPTAEVWEREERRAAERAAEAAERAEA